MLWGLLFVILPSKVTPLLVFYSIMLGHAIGSDTLHG